MITSWGSAISFVVLTQRKFTKQEKATIVNQNVARGQERSVNEYDNVTEMQSKFIRKQSASQNDMEPFEGNPLDFTYFISMKKIDDLRRKLTQFIK